MNNNVEAYIARNKSRLKSYGEKVYLKNGDNFEIEMFNGHTTEVLAKIWINDELISTSGLILKPGQRFFLERWIDDNNRFKFNTYDVEASKEALEAIKNNGKIRVQFYPKSTNHSIVNQSIIDWDLWHSTKTSPIQPYVQDWTINTPYHQPMFTTTNYCSNQIGTTSLETGRVEKGGSSNQSFINVNMDFSPFAMRNIEMQILPVSTQPIEVSQIRNYCSGCGTRIKKQSWKFCPNCGTNLD